MRPPRSSASRKSAEFRPLGRRRLRGGLGPCGGLPDQEIAVGEYRFDVGGGGRGHLTP